MIIRFDIYKHNPWRAPGSAPVLDACGLAGGTPWGGDVAEWGRFDSSHHADDLSGVALMLLGMLIMRMRMSFCLLRGTPGVVEM